MNGKRWEKKGKYKRNKYREKFFQSSIEEERKRALCEVFCNQRELNK